MHGVLLRSSSVRDVSACLKLIVFNQSVLALSNTEIFTQVTISLVHLQTRFGVFLDVYITSLLWTVIIFLSLNNVVVFNGSKVKKRLLFYCFCCCLSVLTVLMVITDIRDISL